MTARLMWAGARRKSKMGKYTWFILGFFIGGVCGIFIHAHLTDTLFV